MNQTEKYEERKRDRKIDKVKYFRMRWRDKIHKKNSWIN